MIQAETRNQYTALPLVIVLVTRFKFKISKFYIYKLSYNSNQVLYQFLEIGTSDKTFIGRDQELKWLAFSLYPLSIFLYSPFNKCLFRLWIGYYRREYKRRKRFFYLRVHKIYCIRYILILTSEILGEHFKSVLTYCLTFALPPPPLKI